MPTTHIIGAGSTEWDLSNTKQITNEDAENMPKFEITKAADGSLTKAADVWA